MARGPRFVPSRRLADAVAFAAEAHHDQVRKETTIPYLSHLLGVAGIAMELGADEDEAVAAVLHDVVEDTDVDADTLREAFGDRVADIVVACSTEARTGDPERDAYRRRKGRYVAHLAGRPDLDGEQLTADDPGRAPASAVLVSLADKLHNARAIATDVRRDGDAAFDRFSGSIADVRWYYRRLLAAYRHRLDDPDARIDAAAVADLEAAVAAFAPPTGDADDRPGDDR
jgi:(p)ppGpp synthase/HD superfamily hydrolase